MSYKPKSKKQEHPTPDSIFNIIFKEWGFKNMFDPCPIGTPYKAPCFFNGLYGNWKKINYVNCPFEVKTLRKFYQKALEQSEIGNKTIMLLPSKTDQDWFHNIIEKGFKIKWIRGRIKFKFDKHHAPDCHFLVKI